jgi:hypothetical protein
MAANCWLLPAAMEAVVGVTEIEVSTAGVTVNDADPLMAPEVAVIAVDPWAMAVAVPPGLTVAAETTDEAQVTLPLRFWLLPLL